MCDCWSVGSNNGMVPNFILDPNRFFDWDSPGKRVAVDACIAEQIRELWAHGIWTRSSCCGHGERNPSVVIDESVDGLLAVEVLQSCDPSRSWEVQQWQLTTIEPAASAAQE